MSVLLVVAGGDVERVVAKRLLTQGDEVRVVITDASAKDDWVALGAHVALGDPTDDDLIERAGQSARTLVLFDGKAADSATLGAAVKAASAAGVDRLILCAPEIPQESRRTLTDSGLGFVILTYGRRLSLKGRASPALVAEAVDAADDLSGEPALEIDLREPGALDRLAPGHPA